MNKKVLALLLTLCMLFTLVPGNVFAEEANGEQSLVSSDEDTQQTPENQAAENADEGEGENGEIFVATVGDDSAPADTTTVEVEGVKYKVAGETAQVTDGESASGNVVILEKVTINGSKYPVTSVAGNAFNDANEVTSVVVPNSVTSLGNAAFANMDKLTSITIGNGVTSWGSKLAVNNYELTTVEITEGATLIGDTAFRTCPKLANITLPSTLETIGATAFSGSAITELNIPASVKKIGADAFKDIDTLKKVTFNSVPETFGTTVFQMCDGLEEVVLPEGLKVIPQGTFRSCTALKTINFPESLTEIGNYSFQGCTSLESVAISKNITKLVTNAFNGCTSLKNLTIEEGFNGTIGGYAFQGCTALETVVIPSSMETVGESMFNMCYSLKNVTLSEGVKTLNISAFANCTSLESLTLPDSLERMRHGSIANCTALKELIITGDNLPVIEHSNALDGLTDELVVVYDGDDEFTGNWAALVDKNMSQAEYDKFKKAVATVNGEYFDYFDEAVTAANEATNGATVELLKDVTLGEKLTISGNVTISGEHTITRDDAYTGTLFTVNAGATLTLDGGLTIDGGNNYAFNSELYNADLKAMASIPKADAEKYFTPEAGAPVATAYMITLAMGTSADAFGGTVNLNNVTVQNNYSINSGIVSAAQYTETNLNGAKISHVAGTQTSGVVVNASGAGIKVNMNGDTVIDGNHVGGNHGIFKIYSGTVFTMNGGEVKNTTGWNSNGTVVGLYGGTFVMNGGKICSNSAVYGSSNGRNAAIYLHSKSVMEMNGGTICHNTGRSRGGIDSSQSTSNLTITGGEVLDNISLAGNTTADVGGTVGTWEITGGTFTQDVSAWLAPDSGLVYNEETRTYGLTNNLYEYNGTAYTTLAEVIADIAAAPATLADEDTTPVVKVLASHKVDDAIVIGTNLVLDLNGKTITGAAKDGVQVYPVIRVQGDANVTVKNGTITNDDYVFVLGASDGSSAGNLTIESGKYHGNTTVASVTKGDLTILGGEFSVEPYNGSYDFLLNCIDANYKDGSAKIVVKGGTFKGFNPANNAAEGAGTSFVAEGYKSVADGDNFVVRVNKDTLAPIVTITFTDSNTNSEVTLKYPSERYDTIQKLIGTNDYADFVIGAEQSELLAYIAGGRASNIVMTLHTDIELDAPLNFYNKYFQIDVSGYEITINGNGHTITWADGYTGTLFNVEPGVSLTTKNITIDGENEFTFYDDTTTVENGQNWYTRFVNVGEEDKAVNGDVIVNAGDLTLGEGTVIKNVTIAADSTNGKTENTDNGGYILKYNDNLAIVKSTGGKVTLNGAQITGNAGQMLNVSNTESNITNATIDGNMGCGRNGGIIEVNGGTMTITDSSIINNKAMARSATVLGVIGGAEVTFSGTMGNNKHIGVGSNTAGAMVVLEGASQFVMDGGSISNNVGGRAGAIASRWVGGDYGQHEETSIVLNAGTITDNTADENYGWNGAAIFLRSPATIGEGMTVEGNITVNAAPGELKIAGGDFSGSLIVTSGLKAEITGGTFDYDPTEWLAPNTGLTYDEETGTYKVTNHIYNLYFRDPTTGEQVLGVGPLQGNDPASLVATGKLFYADYYEMELEVLSNAKIDETIVIDYPMTVNLNGKTITTAATAAGDAVDAFTILADVTITGGGTVDARPSNGYVFYVGDKKGKEGNLTIENGTFISGDCTVAQATTGTVTIEGGTFQATEYEGAYDFTLNCFDTNYKDGKASIVVKGGTFYKFNPADNAAENPKANFCANGYVPVYDADTDTYTVKEAIAQVGDVQYTDLKEALEACTNGETVTIIDDITYGKDDVVNAIGGATGFGDYPNPSIIYVGGTKGATDAENQPSNVNAVIDLNGHTITNNADAYLFMIMDNAKVTFKDSSVAKTGAVISTTDTPVIWTVGTETLVTIESGKYETASARGLLHITHGGDMVITGGEFRTIADDASLLIMLNTHDRQNSKFFISGKATVTISGGIFHGFNPEKVGDDNGAASIEDIKFVDGCAEGFAPVDNGNGTYGVVDYVEWIKKELLKGRNVTLTRDVVVDGSYITSEPHAVNTYGKYPNYGIFTVVGDYDVTIDLNGYDVTYNGHAGFEWNGKTYNSCTVAHGLFFANGGADLTIKDSKGTSDITVYGLASGAYVASNDTTFTIKGGTWKNEGCKTCGGTNIFLYPLQGGELYIEDGYFDQALDSENESYLIVEHGGEYKNLVIDYSKTKVEISGGTFVGMNPGEIKKFIQTADNKLDTTSEPTTDGCAEGYAPVDNGDGTYGIVEKPVVAMIGEVKYYSFADALAAAEKLNVTTGADVVIEVYTTVTLDTDGEYDLTSIRINAVGIENAPVFRVLADVTFKGGIVDGRGPVAGEGGINCYAFIVGDSETAGTLTITSGTYRGVTSAISITNGTVNISGGTFQTGHDNEGTDYGTQYLLNCMDAAYNAGTAVYNITGGKFVGFNPENNAAEGTGTNFLSDNYKASDYYGDNKWYVAEANVVMDGNKYFATIKDALAILSSADTTVHKVKVLNNLEIDVNYSTYNYPILVNGFAIELDLNGKTITADWSKYTGSRVDNALIGVCNGGKLTVIDSVGGGKIVNDDNKDNVENRIFWIMTSTATKSIEVVIKGGTFVQSETNTALLYVQGNKPSDNLAPIYVTIEGGHFETVNNDFFNAYDGYQHESYITGGTFNKNPSDWEIKIHPDYEVLENDDGTYGVIPSILATVEVEMIPGAWGTSYITIENWADLEAALGENTNVPVKVTLLDNVVLTETLVISGNKDVTIDLNGKTITTAATAAGTYVDAFTILADVTITGEGTIDARPSHGYAFYVGDKNDNAGNLTIENGTFYGETSVVNNRLGTVTINGGTFEISLENEGDAYNYVLNCVDDNYKNGTAKIEVKGGTFYKFNPENNAAEGVGTNFVAEGYFSVDNDNGTYKVAKAVAKIDETKYYDSLSEALAEAAKMTGGATVTLLTNADADLVVVYPGVTLDLNGNTLNANYVIGLNGSHVIDSSENNAGLLVVDKDNISLAVKNAQLPAYVVENGVEGYKFFVIELGPKLEIDQANNKATFGFMVRKTIKDNEEDKGKPTDWEALYTLFSDNGAEDHDISVMVEISWTEEQGTASQRYVYNKDFVKKAATDQLIENGGMSAFMCMLEGINDKTKISYTAVIVSGTRAEITSVSMS